MRRWYRQWYASDVPTWPGLGMARWYQQWFGTANL
jgi:hypothetical protein